MKMCIADGVLDREEYVDAWLSPSKQPLQLARVKTKVMFSILLFAYLCNNLKAIHMDRYLIS